MSNTHCAVLVWHETDFCFLSRNKDEGSDFLTEREICFLLTPLSKDNMTDNILLIFLIRNLDFFSCSVLPLCLLEPGATRNPLPLLKRYFFEDRKWKPQQYSLEMSIPWMHWCNSCDITWLTKFIALYIIWNCCQNLLIWCLLF